MAEAEVQRALGRIEGDVRRLLGEFTNHRAEFVAHQRLDLESLGILAKTLAQQRDVMLASFEEQDRARNQHLNEQDVKLDVLKQDNDRAKGAGWVILGLLGALATFLGAAVISALSGIIKFH